MIRHAIFHARHLVNSYRIVCKIQSGIDKCKVLHLNFNGNQNLNYLLNGVEMKKSGQEKDLGVLTSRTLLWNDQINSCVSKANHE